MTNSDKTLPGSQQGLSSSSADAHLSRDGKSVEGITEINQSILDEALESVEGGNMMGLSTLKGRSMMGLNTLKREIKNTKIFRGSQKECDSGHNCIVID